MAITYLSGERIQGSNEADVPLGDGLKAYYKMDESSGSTFTNDAGDITGNSSIGSAGNLTITGATLAQSGSPTNFGTNTDFDGSSDYARAGVGTEANFNFLHDGSDWSVSFWAKMYATGSNQHIFDNKGAVGEDASGLDIRTMTTARWRVFGTKASGFYCVENTTDNYIPDTTNFHHYVMTWDNSTTTVSFYRDGANKETHSASSGGAAGTAEDRLVVGGTSAPSGTLNGKVCELAMWNTVLTDAQVSRIYNGGDGRVLTLAGVEDDKTTITTVPTGTRFEEINTRKIFRRNDTKALWTERGVAEPSRACFGGGESSSSDVNTIDYVTVGTLGNAADFGDLTQAREGVSCCSSLSRGVFSCGNTGSDVNTMDYITTWSAGNATDFGDATLAARYRAGCASTAGRGLIAGGYTTSGATKHDVIEYITIASTGNGTDFGDKIGNHSDHGACDNGTRAVIGGGQN